MKLYVLKCYTIFLDEFNRKVGCSIPFTTKAEALKAFKLKVKDFRDEYYDIAESIHECIGKDPCVFEYDEELITFELIAESMCINLDVEEIEVFDTISEAKKTYTIFE